MAEVSGMVLNRDSTITIKDGTGTPLTMTVINTEGQASMTNGGHTWVRQQDNAGDFTGVVRKGAQAGVSTFTMEAKVLLAGNHASVATYIDLTKGSGYGVVGSGWVSTSATIDAEAVTVDVEVATVDRTLTGGDVVKGATYKLNDCIAQPGSSISMTRDGWKISATFESADPYITITQNS